MLKIKYIPKFEDDDTLIVIVGEEENYLIASKYLSNRTESRLDDPNFATYYDSGILPRELLHLNKKDCAELSEMFAIFASQRPKIFWGCHDYYQTKALSDLEIELYISKGEFNENLFKDE